MPALSDSRGILYPHHLPRFERRPAPADLTHMIRWFWIPRWNLPPGEVSTQKVLPFPATNLVIEPSMIALHGPTTKLSTRKLRGSGWAVGALLRPAGTGALHPGMTCGTTLRINAPALHRSVVSSMPHDADTAVDTYAQWMRERAADVNEGWQLANRMEDIIAGDRGIVRVEQVAEQLHVSVRSVQRLAKRYVGVSPVAMIRRYRLQEAAQRLREDTHTTIAQIAADLRYADHAHLNAECRQVLGFNPGDYRRTSI